MRKLMWFTIGFAAACGVGVYLTTGLWLLLLVVFALAAVIVLLCIKSAWTRLARCILLGFTLGCLWLWCFDALYLIPARQMDGRADIITIDVTEYSESTDIGVRSVGRARVNGRTYTVQFYLNEGVSLAPGDRIEGGFRFRYTGGGAERPTYHQGKGIFLLCYPKGEINVFSNTERSVYHMTSVLRAEILSLLDRVFPEDTAPFARALLLGDTNNLDPNIKSNLKVSGIYHVVAVSGMHVSILFALVQLLCGRRRVLTALIGIPVLFLFAAVAGFSPSIVRACIMQILIILAALASKEYDPPTALAAAVLIILAVNPLGITSISLQLSAGCIVGILLFTQRIHDYLLQKTPLGPAKGKSIKARLIRWAVGSVSVTLGAMSVVTPLSALYFGSISLSGIAANLLLLGPVSIIFYGVMAAGAFGAVWLPMGRGIGGIVSWLIRGVLWVVNMISEVPVSAVYTSSIYIVAWLVFCYVLLAVFLKMKKKHPWVLTGCLLVGLIAAIGLSWAEPRLDEFRITAVDVSQGQCLILQTDGKYYMVDCGGDSDEEAADEAAKLLLSQGVFSLDGLIITHYDQDHAGGAPILLDRIPADALYLPVISENDPIRDALVDRFSDRIYWVEEDLRLESADITIFPSFETEDSNESSLCILFQPENCDILITGDRSAEGERALMESVKLPDLEILVAGHHGSRYSTSWDLLDATRPEIVIISVGADNRYGHPTTETLERLNLFGCKIYRTDLQGTIIFRG